MRGCLGRQHLLVRGSPCSLILAKPVSGYFLGYFRLSLVRPVFSEHLVLRTSFGSISSLFLALWASLNGLVLRTLSIRFYSLYFAFIPGASHQP